MLNYYDITEKMENHETPPKNKENSQRITSTPADVSSDKESLSIYHSNKSRTAVTIGTNVSDALKANLAKAMGTAFANFLIATTDKIATEEISEESEDGDEKTPRKCPPMETMRRWLSSAEAAFKEFANFIMALKINADGQKTLESLYREDIKKTVGSIMHIQNLFDNASPIAKGLARFNVHSTLLPSDKNLELDKLIMVDISVEKNAFNTLIIFKDEIKALFCLRVKELLKHLSSDSATLIFNDIVNFVRKSFSFYKSWGDLPGTEFRILLADINIKIMERALAESKSKKFLEHLSSCSILGALNLSEEDIRTMINALQKIREWKPLSKDHPTRVDKARDIVLLQETGNIDRIPVTPTDLLELTFFINALWSLEQRNVFTNGFFNAVCVLISQSLSNQTTNNSVSLLRPSKLAAKMVQNSLLNLRVIKNDGTLQIERKGEENEDQEEEEEEPMSVDASSSEDEPEDDDEEVLKLIYKTGGFFYDTSEFGKKIRSLISSKDHVGLAKYAFNVLDSKSKIAIERLVATLTDIIILKTEECEELKNTCSCYPQKKNDVESTVPRVELKALVDPHADKNVIASYFLNVVEPTLVSKHEAYVLTEHLLPLHNDINALIQSFFNNSEMSNLFKFSKHILDEMSRIFVSHTNEGTRKEMSLDSFLQTFSPLGSQINLLVKIKMLMLTDKKDKNSLKILFSQEKENNNTVTGLKLTSLIDTVKNSAHLENIRKNAADLHNNKTALALILFPPPEEDEITILSKLAAGLFSIIEESIAVVDFDESNDSYALVLDTDTMREVVKFTASTLQDATAKALYADENMRSSKIFEQAFSVKRSLSYLKVPDSKPTPLAKRIITSIIEKYLKQLNKTSKVTDQTSDRALIEVVTNGTAADIVSAQITNAVGLAIVASAAIKIVETEAAIKEKTILQRSCLIKNLTHLCLTIAVAAASNMTKLCNPYFFNFIEEANIIANTESSKVLESANLSGGTKSWITKGFGENNLIQPSANIKFLVSDEDIYDLKVNDETEKSVFEKLNEMV